MLIFIIILIFYWIKGEINNFFTNTLPDGFINAVNTVVDPVLNVANLVGGLFISPPTSQDQNVNICDLTCKSRYNVNGQDIDYFFDRPNGCISKGFSGPRADVFNSCCDRHNECLNARCCTTECADLKQECDSAYEACTKQSCFQFVADNAKFLECIGDSITVSNAAKSATCNANSATSRKLCYCHV
jgi:hypothetical protein